MKIIRSLILVSSILIWGLCLPGCESDTPTEASLTGTLMQEKSAPMASKEKKEVMDSLTKLTYRFADIENSIATQGTEITELNSTLTATKNTVTILSGVAITFAVITLVIAGVSIYLINKLQKRLDRHRNDIDNLNKSVASAQSPQQPRQPVKPTSTLSNDYDKLIARVKVLEQKVAQVTSPMPPHNLPTQVVAPNAKSEQVGYFGVPLQMSQTEAYFKKLIESASDPDVRFTAKVRGDYAVFEPKEGTISSLKSSETMKLAVETNGCLLSDATSMKTLKPGAVELIDTRWVITKKAQILLLK